MEDIIPDYQGKPTAYLDQNILDLFVTYGLGGFSEELVSKYQVVYSDETLNEIKRSGDHASKFLNILKELGAYQLKIVFEQPGFIPTERFTLSSCDPFEAYEEYCETISEHSDIQHAMEQSLYKFSGGRVGDGISDIHNEQKLAFSGLMEQLQTQMSELNDELPGIEGLFQDYAKEAISELESTLDKTEYLMKANIADDKNWSGIKEFRNSVGVGPKELNNIKPPNVLKQIWEIYRAIPPHDSMGVSIDDMFGLAKNPIYPDQPYFNYQKITGIYNMLNTYGYYPDSKVHKERRFVAALSDNSHASLASFCNMLFSRDEYFIYKVRAAYEFLEIPTLVQHVVVKNA